MLSSTVAALAGTWILWCVVLVGIGGFVRPRSSSLVGRVWLGLAVVSVIATSVSLAMPLSATGARMIMWGVVAVGVLGALYRWRALKSWWWVAIPLASTSLALLASVAPGNYDTGLYHLGSIAYVREGGTVVGLANLHDRFGFSSVMWPLSAASGLGLWDGSEFRLVNGLLMIAALTDLTFRLRGSLRRSPGTYVLVGGLLLVAGAIVQYPGRLIASSAQDTAAVILIVVSGAYLLDYLTAKRSRLLAAVAIVTAGLSGAVRPLGWVFLATTLVVVFLSSGGWNRAWRTAWPGALVAAFLVVPLLLRDALTSGWLFFPAQVFPLPVSWRVTDPESAARDIAGWARTPFQDVDVTLGSSEWFSGWLLRLPTDWSIPALAAVVIGVVVWVLASPSARMAIHGSSRALLGALTPGAVTLVVWFVTAPDPRFAWGPLLLLGLLPLGVAATSLSRPVLAWWAVGAVGFMLLLVALARGSLIGTGWHLTAVPETAVRVTSLVDGTKVAVPVNGDQCWDEFPLCRPWYAKDTVSLRGESWREGFQPIP